MGKYILEKIKGLPLDHCNGSVKRKFQYQENLFLRLNRSTCTLKYKTHDIMSSQELYR